MMSCRPIIHICIVCDYDDFLSFQVMNRKCTALVISPLRALCLDQVSFLCQHNVLACWLNPDMESKDRQGFKSGIYTQMTEVVHFSVTLKSYGQTAPRRLKSTTSAATGEDDNEMGPK